MNHKEIRKQILGLTTQYYTERFANEKFEKGKTRVNYAGRVFDEKELVNLVDAALDFWLTEGRYSEAFAEKISELLGISNVILVNSGSSANLAAFSALTSGKLGDKRIKPGDEVISAAASFPSTVTPIIQNNMIPVFVDVDIPTYNIDINMMEKAISEKTRCIFLAHTLGNPFDINAVMKLAKEYNLWVIEDNCDAFGSKYNGKYTGTFGHISTISFYPAHHITTGEGGAVLTNDEQLSKIIKSFRDWGRDCYCAGGENNTCGKRFSQQFGTLPNGYDHKYVYSEIGYNLKMTDIQAALGLAQLEKLGGFIKKRHENFDYLFGELQKFKKYFILPEWEPKADPDWFGFLLTVKQPSKFTREDLLRFLGEKKIGTRLLFAGNVARQPYFKTYNIKSRAVGDLKNADTIMNNTFWIGVYPGLNREMLKYTVKCFEEFLKRYH